MAPTTYLQAPTEQQEQETFSPHDRPESIYYSLDTFNLPPANARKYSTQFSDLYFARLALLKSQVEDKLHGMWDSFELGGQKATRVDRVLDVRQGELCWVVGTIFMDMTLKPNILDDLSKEAYIIAPPARETYRQSDGSDLIVLEDESGRLPITGKYLSEYLLCTGCIVGAMGTENKDGLFEIIAIEPVDLPPQPERWALHHQNQSLNAKGMGEKSAKARLANANAKSKAEGKIAIVSGLGFDGHSNDTVLLDTLQEFLLGELGDGEQAAPISRLIIAGNAFGDMAPIPTREELMRKSVKKHGTEPSAYNASPAEQVDAFIACLLPSIPVTLIPGISDPTSVSLPQPAIHPAMFPHSRRFAKHPNDSQATSSTSSSWFDSVSNPWDGEIDGWRVLATGGQPINDMVKYLARPNRLVMMESFLRWRNIAPTAPDTLWTYPYQEDDPFVLRSCPHIYIAGDQPRFESKLIQGPQGQSTRLIAVPSFRRTGCVVLLDAETLEVECVRFQVFREHMSEMNGGGGGGSGKGVNGSGKAG